MARARRFNFSDSRSTPERQFDGPGQGQAMEMEMASSTDDNELVPGPGTPSMSRDGNHQLRQRLKSGMAEPGDWWSGGSRARGLCVVVSLVMSPRLASGPGGSIQEVGTWVQEMMTWAGEKDSGAWDCWPWRLSMSAFDRRLKREQVQIVCYYGLP